MATHVSAPNSMPTNSNRNLTLNSSILDSALIAVEELLGNFAAETDFLGQLSIAFGDRFNLTAATELQAQFLTGTFDLPTIEIRSRDELQGLLGAYATTTDTIYLSESWLETATISQVVAVLLEEIGHGVDARINDVDSLGDEGAIFSSLVQGQDLSLPQLQTLQSERDHYTLTLDGQAIQVEAATLTIAANIATTGTTPINVTGDNIVVDNSVTVSVVNGNLTMLANNGGAQLAILPASSQVAVVSLPHQEQAISH